MDGAQPHAEVPQAVLDHIRLVISQTRILVAVTCGVYMWEWSTNLSAEYTFIWKSKLRPLNVVFLLLRYYTFLALGIIAWVAFWEGDDMEKCARMVLLLPYMPLVIFALANIIIIARVFAMWDQDKRVLALLSCVYVAQIVVQSYVPRNLKPLALPPGIRGCGPWVQTGFRYRKNADVSYGFRGFLESAYVLYWSMNILFDTTVLALSLIKLVMLWQANGYMSNLVRILFRDQIIFYLLTFAVNVTNIIVYYADRKGGVGKDFISPVAAGITSMAICRVVLNLRREAIKDTTFSGSSRSRGGKASQNHGVVTPTFPLSNFPGTASSRDAQSSRDAGVAAVDLEKQTPFEQLADEQLDTKDSFRLQPVPRK